MEQITCSCGNKYPANQWDGAYCVSCGRVLTAPKITEEKQKKLTEEKQKKLTEEKQKKLTEEKRKKLAEERQKKLAEEKQKKEAELKSIFDRVSLSDAEIKERRERRDRLRRVQIDRDIAEIRRKRGKY